MGFSTWAGREPANLEESMVSKAMTVAMIIFGLCITAASSAVFVGALWERVVG